MSGTVSGVLDGSALPVEECCGEEKFLRVEQDIIETAEERDPFTSHRKPEDRLSNLSEQFDWDRDRKDEENIELN